MSMSTERTKSAMGRVGRVLDAGKVEARHGRAHVERYGVVGDACRSLDVEPPLARVEPCRPGAHPCGARPLREAAHVDFDLAEPVLPGHEAGHHA
jgi:hypothetical protein